MDEESQIRLKAKKIFFLFFLFLLTGQSDKKISPSSAAVGASIALMRRSKARGDGSLRVGKVVMAPLCFLIKTHDDDHTGICSLTSRALGLILQCATLHAVWRG